MAVSTVLPIGAAMNRRGFFGLLGAAATAVVVPELVELLAPTRTIFLPPVGGWRVFAPQLWVDEFMRQVRAKLELEAMALCQIDRMYDPAFLSGNQWTPAEMARASTINITRPPRYDVRAEVGPERWQARDADLRAITSTIADVIDVPRGSNYRGGA